MKAILLQDVVNPYVPPRKTEVELTLEERRQYVKEHRNAKAVPDTKVLESPVFYAKKGEELDVFESSALKAFGPDQLDIFILISKSGERFIVKRDLLTVKP